MISHLVRKGEDEAHRPLAAADLANPSEPMEQVALADGWWQAAESSQGTACWQLRRHAAHWYRTARFEFKGLVQRKVVQRLEEAKSDGESLLATSAVYSTRQQGGPAFREPVEIPQRGGFGSVSSSR